MEIDKEIVTTTTCTISREVIARLVADYLNQNGVPDAKPVNIMFTVSEEDDGYGYSYLVLKGATFTTVTRE